MKLINRDIRKIVKAAEQRGWIASLTRGGHVRLEHPLYATVFGPQTPSCYRGVKNFEAKITKSERHPLVQTKGKVRR